MAILKKFLYHSSLYFSTKNINYLFEFPYELFGFNHSFKNATMPAKLIIPKINCIDSIFVGNSRSLGVLFLRNRNIKIYITQPVYHQILLRYEELPKYISYEDVTLSNDEELVSILDADIKGFQKKCIFIKYNEIISDINLDITCIPNSSYIGWCNYMVRYKDSKLSFLIVNSICYHNRFSVSTKNVLCEFLVDLRVPDSKRQQRERFCEERIRKDNEKTDSNTKNIDDAKQKNTACCMNTSINQEPSSSTTDDTQNAPDFYKNLVPGCMSNRNNNKVAVKLDPCSIYDDILPSVDHALNDNSIISKVYSRRDDTSMQDEQNPKRYKKGDEQNKKSNIQGSYERNDVIQDGCKTLNEQKEVDNLKVFIEKCVKDKIAIIIPIQITEIFLEVIFHFFYITSQKNVEITVCSNIFEKLSTIVNIQSEWLSESFGNSVNRGQEPFSFKTYGSFSSCSSIFELQKIPQILFLSTNEYNFIEQPKLFDNQCVLTFNKAFAGYNYNSNINLEATVQEVLENNTFSRIMLDYEHENTELIKPGSYYVIVEDAQDARIKIKDTHKIQVYKQGKELQFFIEGSLTNFDNQVIVKPTKNTINDLFRTKRYCIVNDCYCFYTEGIKVKFDDNKVKIEKLG